MVTYILIQTLAVAIQIINEKNMLVHNQFNASQQR